MAPHSSTLAWKIPWTEEPGGLQSMRLLRVRHDWTTSLSLFTFMHSRRKWQPTPVFLPGESQGRGQPGGLPSMGSHRVGHDCSDLAAAAAARPASEGAACARRWKKSLLISWWAASPAVPMWQVVQNMNSGADYLPPTCCMTLGKLPNLSVPASLSIQLGW